MGVDYKNTIARLKRSTMIKYTNDIDPNIKPYFLNNNITEVNFNKDSAYY